MMNRGILNPMRYSHRMYNEPGVYRSQGAGLLSISDTGGNWITIADKNLGATKVYELRDDIDQDNCGKFYQWGNNYGFPYPTQTDNLKLQSYYELINTTGYGPGNYYNSNIFVGGRNNWQETMNYDLWGYNTGTFEAAQGPCPEGFHVFFHNRDSIIWNYNNFPDVPNILERIFHVPLPGFFDGEMGGIGDGDRAFWSNQAVNSNYAYSIGYDHLDPLQTECLPIRPIKNEVAIPDSTWTKEYEGQGYGHTVVQVFHQTALGLISCVINGTTVQTMADKNLGATKVYNYGDTLSTENCGYFYCRGNNHGFEGFQNIYYVKTGDAIDLSQYGPDNYYNSDIYRPGDFSNNNLRGDVTNTTPARRGPCPKNFHVPTKDEVESLKQKTESLGITVMSDFMKYLKCPPRGARRKTSSDSLSLQYIPRRWTSSSDGSNAAYVLEGPQYSDERSRYGVRVYGRTKSIAACVRPFRDVGIVPDDTRTKLY